MKFLILVFLSGCWLAPPPSYLVSHRNVQVVDQARTGKPNVQIAIDEALKLLGAHPQELRGWTIHVVDAPICVQQDDLTMTVADGLTLPQGKIILASTVQGCFHAITHEIVHVLRGPGHEDKELWGKVEAIEKYIQSHYCAGVYKPMTPEEAADAC